MQWHHFCYSEVIGHRMLPIQEAIHDLHSLKSVAHSDQVIGTTSSSILIWYRNSRLSVILWWWLVQSWCLQVCIFLSFVELSVSCSVMSCCHNVVSLGCERRGCTQPSTVVMAINVSWRHGVRKSSIWLLFIQQWVDSQDARWWHYTLLQAFVLSW